MTGTGVTFDFTVRVTDIVTLGMGIAFAIAAFHKIKSTLAIFSFHLEIIDATIEDLKKATKDGNVVESRLDRVENDNAMLRREIFELQRGRGFVQSEISGEYTKAGKVGA
jgi:hypothetical protein